MKLGRHKLPLECQPKPISSVQVQTSQILWQQLWELSLGISTLHTALTFRNLEFWSSNSRISSSIFLIFASAVTFSSCSFCRAPSSSSSCSSRSWEERNLHLCISQVIHGGTFWVFNLMTKMCSFEKPLALTDTKPTFALLDSFTGSMIC